MAAVSHWRGRPRLGPAAGNAAGLSAAHGSGPGEGDLAEGSVRPVARDALGRRFAGEDRDQAIDRMRVLEGHDPAGPAGTGGPQLSHRLRRPGPVVLVDHARRRVSAVWTGAARRR